MGKKAYIPGTSMTYISDEEMSVKLNKHRMCFIDDYRSCILI